MTCCLNTAAFSILWQVVLCIDLSVFYTAPLVPPHVPRPPCRYFEWLGPKHFLLNDTSLSALCLDSATGRDHVSGSCCKWVRWTSGWLAVSWSEKKNPIKSVPFQKLSKGVRILVVAWQQIWTALIRFYHTITYALHISIFFGETQPLKKSLCFHVKEVGETGSMA